MLTTLMTPMLAAAFAATLTLPPEPAAIDGGGRRAEIKARILERFDENQDGKLDVEERQALRGAARSKLQERRQNPGFRRAPLRGHRFGLRGQPGARGERLGIQRPGIQRPGIQRPGIQRRGLARPGVDGRARLGGGARPARGKAREVLLKKFDANSDGELSPAEREQAREAFLKWRQTRRGR